LIVTVLVFPLLAGCLDYKDLNKLSIVAGMAFEGGGDEDVKIAIEIVDRSSAQRQDGLRTRVVHTSGKTVDSAVKKISKGLDFELYYGAMAVIIFKSDEPCPEIFDWLIKNHEVRETVYVIFSHKGGELLESEEDGGIASYKLRDILDASEDEKPLELYKLEGVYID
jgi:spore germination protein KC